ncbi:RNA-binding protein SART3 (RRM superfamily) [Phaffia rhodozyma]|uniref:RNA-binding protein SART3 (RRM superfamily) n=1 Tax=Phaffia rhodozyma TaxID=264483 RepID=A0A0F7SEW3_PHARH|nr:RNA-binding protein SART3 (RRM superfamily) [Phaffia rhodozyma]
MEEESTADQDNLILNALESLPGIIERLAVPGAEFNIDLHRQHIEAATLAELDDQLDQARLLMVQSVACGDDVWLPLLKDFEAKSDLSTAKGIRTMLDLHEQSIADYLSIPLLVARAEFVTRTWYRVREQAIDPDVVLDDAIIALLTEETVREILLETTAAARAHIAQSHLVWNILKDWQLSLLEDLESQEREARLPTIHRMFLDRLKFPHATIDDTFSAYNSFVSAYDNENYESRLVAATKSKTEGAGKWAKRESWEDQLIAPGAHAPSLFPAYIAWELKPKKPDTFLVQSLYARAITDAAARTDALYQAEPFWISLMAFLASNLKIEQVLLSTIFKAVRSVPVSGELWALYMRILEDYQKPVEEIDGIYRTALNSDLLLTRGPEDAVKMMTARVSYERRRLELSEVTNDEFVELLLEAISIVNAGVKRGDPAFKLEKYLISWFERTQQLDEASTIWQGLAKSHSRSYLVWTGWAAFETRRGALPKARDVFKASLGKANNLDWPEAVFEAYSEFEQFYGALEDLDEALKGISKATQVVATKRHKEAIAAAKNAPADPYVSYSTLPAEGAESVAAAPIAGAMDVDPNSTSISASIPTSVDEIVEAGGAPMDSSGMEGDASRKRKAEDLVDNQIENGSEGVKKARAEEQTEAVPPVRDRENSTVFVSKLTPEATQDDLKSLFKECGEIREIKLLAGATFGTVEFMTKESVPAALTRDKKKINDIEVDVSVAEGSTLYITNFPEAMDDTSMRALFEPYGTIIETRWPGKKFKESRRFVYLQFSSSVSAKNALELNKKEIEPGRVLLVAISNPSVKRVRTDAKANDRQIVISHLSKFVKKEDLEKLFNKFGPIKDIQSTSEEDGYVRGYCFIHFEQENSAQQALSMNNYEFKKRRMAVTIPDSRRNQKQIVIEHCARIGNLPSGVQEGLLQQALEKVVKLQKVSVNAKNGEAMVELSSADEVESFISSQNGFFTYDGTPLPIVPGTQKFTTAPSAGSAREESGIPDEATPVAPSEPMFRPPPRPRPSRARPRPGFGPAGRTGRKPPTPAFIPAAATATKQSTENVSGKDVPMSEEQVKPKGQNDFRAMLLKKQG